MKMIESEKKSAFHYRHIAKYLVNSKYCHGNMMRVYRFAKIAKSHVMMVLQMKTILLGHIELKIEKGWHNEAHRDMSSVIEREKKLNETCIVVIYCYRFPPFLRFHTHTRTHTYCMIRYIPHVIIINNDSK